ncbi:MAG: hypothetical protein H6662_15555 [Ardenticatenaceae bacterium]|nr:hypothetical protein [Anaerolineales bacterium]MCB8923003.1 hypothetical protein [Ardenticatenaceae bacterium]MCB8990264.1 hypothetical protein [Ardenticatenaceae bacterium]
MKLLTSLFGGGTASNLRLSVTKEGAQNELPYSEVAKLLWSYFLNNGLYDELRLVGYFLNEPNLKAIRNPAQRVVKFYADTIWPGRLPTALPLDLTGNKGLQKPIEELWKWSNWQARKQLMVRQTAVLGEVFIKVAQPEGKERVYLQLIRPEFITQCERDEQDNITYLRVDVPRARREGVATSFYLHTEVWDKAGGTARFWEHDKTPETPLDQLGAPKQRYDLEATWGIDFVPWVRAVHMDIGESRGVGAYLLQLDKIDEANRLATRLHTMLFRHNDVTWALKANMMDAATGRPLPPPRVATSTDSDGNDVVDLAGEKFIRLPGMSELQSLVPNLNYEAALSALNAHMAELKNDLPELRYYDLPELGELSGRAIRLLMGPAVTNAAEVRSNLEDALVRAQKMALTIGQNAGIWENLGSYEDGDLEHGFEERPIIPIDRYEQAEIIKAEKEAGLPLFTSLRKSGADETEMAEVEADYARQQAMTQAGMASALLEAQAQFDAGQPGQNGAAEPAKSPQE